MKQTPQMRQDQDLFNEYTISSSSSKKLVIVQTIHRKTVASVNSHNSRPNWLRVQSADDLVKVLPDDAKHEAEWIWANWAI